MGGREGGMGGREGGREGREGGREGGEGGGEGGGGGGRGGGGPNKPQQGWGGGRGRFVVFLWGLDQRSTEHEMTIGGQPRKKEEKSHHRKNVPWSFVGQEC